MLCLVLCLVLSCTVFFFFFSKKKIDDNDNDTQRSPSNSRWKPGLTGMQVWLALLARFALAHSKMTVCSKSDLEEKRE